MSNEIYIHNKLGSFWHYRLDKLMVAS